MKPRVGERATRSPNTKDLFAFTLPVILEPSSTALVIVDMQYASAYRTTGLGRWLASQGRANEGNYRFDRIENLLIPNITRLLDFFRENDLRRIFVRLGSQVRD